MKKILLIILCIIISLTFISCSKISIEDDKSTAENTFNSIMSPGKFESDENKNDNTDLKYKGKNVKQVKLNSSLGINIDADAEILKAFEYAENDTAVPDTELETAFGNVEIIYADNTSETIGTVYLGSDKALYLKFNNNKNKAAAYKLADSIL